MEFLKEIWRIDFKYKDKKYYIKTFNPLWWIISLIEGSIVALGFWIILILPHLMVLGY